MGNRLHIFVFFLSILSLYLGLNIRFSEGGYGLIPHKIAVRFEDKRVCCDRVSLVLFVLAFVFGVLGFII